MKLTILKILTKKPPNQNTQMLAAFHSLPPTPQERFHNTGDLCKSRSTAPAHSQRSQA